MIPADTEHIADEYCLLLGELTKYNAELLEKRKVLAITKCDLIDEEIQGWIREELQNELPENLPLIFISGAAHQGLSELKDLLWHELNRETKHRAESIIQQHFLDFVERLPTEVRRLQQLVFRALDQITDVIDVLGLQAVCRADSQLHHKIVLADCQSTL